MKVAGIEDVIDAAKRHGDSSGIEQEVLDLREALRLAWLFISEDAHNDFMTHSTIWDIVRNAKAPTPWEPAVFSDSMFYLARRVATVPEAKCGSDGRVELFHTKFKAQRRANALNKED